MSGGEPTVHARFVVLREQPLLALDLDGPAPALPLVDDNLLKTLVERGLAMVPGFYDVQLPKGARVGWTLTSDELRLEDESETRLLRVPRQQVDPVWEAAALRLQGTMLCAGWNVGIGAEQTPRELCDALDATARAGGLAGAIVGVAEPRTGLPLMF